MHTHTQYTRTHTHVRTSIVMRTGMSRNCRIVSLMCSPTSLDHCFLVFWSNSLSGSRDGWLSMACSVRAKQGTRQAVWVCAMDPGIDCCSGAEQRVSQGLRAVLAPARWLSSALQDRWASFRAAAEACTCAFVSAGER